MIFRICRGGYIPLIFVPEWHPWPTRHVPTTHGGSFPSTPIHAFLRTYILSRHPSCYTPFLPFRSSFRWVKWPAHHSLFCTRESLTIDVAEVGSLGKGKNRGENWGFFLFFDVENLIFVSMIWSFSCDRFIAIIVDVDYSQRQGMSYLLVLSFSWYEIRNKLYFLHLSWKSFQNFDIHLKFLTYLFTR